MDWVTFFKDYPLVIPAVSALLVAILGFIFARWNSDRNRKLERRAAIYDMRIKEAREYLEMWKRLIQSIRQIYLVFTDKPNLIKGSMESFERRYANLPSLVTETIHKKMSLDILNDSELKFLQQKFFLVIDSRIETVIKVFDKLLVDKTYDMKDVNIELLKIPYEVDELITKMQARLDKLAEKI